MPTTASGNRVGIALAILVAGGLGAALAFHYLLSPYLNGQPTPQASQVAAYLLIVLIAGSYLALVTYRQRTWWLTTAFTLSVALSAVSLQTDLNTASSAAWALGLFCCGVVLWLIVRWHVLVAPATSPRSNDTD